MKATYEFGKTVVGAVSHTDILVNLEAPDAETLRVAIDEAFKSLDKQTAPETWLGEYGKVEWLEETRRATPAGSSRTIVASLHLYEDGIDALRVAWEQQRRLGPSQDFVVSSMEAPRFRNSLPMYAMVVRLVESR